MLLSVQEDSTRFIPSFITVQEAPHMNQKMGLREGWQNRIAFAIHLKLGVRVRARLNRKAGAA
jgi:hypothetical protein